jgi:predicted transcriptional regulator
MTTHIDNDTYQDTYGDAAMGIGPKESTAVGEDDAPDVFADPVRFLAGLGIMARVVADTSLPAAA